MKTHRITKTPIEENGVIVGYTRTVDLLDNDTVVDTVVSTENISHTQRGKENRQDRESRVDNLVAQLPVFGLSIADLEKVFLEFKGEFFSYIWLGTDTFKNAITNYNTPGDVLTILDTVANQENQYTIRMSILHELNK